MSKNFILNVNNLKTENDSKKIKDYFLNSVSGIEKVDIDMDLKIVSVFYNESVGSPNVILESLERIGYPAR